MAGSGNGVATWPGRASSRRRFPGPAPARDLAVGSIPGGEERKSVGVVPMEVSKQQRAAEGLPVHEARQPLQPGAGIEHQRRELVVVRGDGYTRSVVAVAAELWPRCGG